MPKPERSISVVLDMILIKISDDRDVIKIHFKNRDTSAAGSLSKERQQVRLYELKLMFASISKYQPEAKVVHGGSWLYNLESYQRLFPETKYGDPRIAHFIGMHALQVLPLVSFYLLKNTKATILLSALYLLLAVYTLVQALQGKPFIKAKNQQQNEVLL